MTDVFEAYYVLTKNPTELKVRVLRLNEYMFYDDPVTQNKKNLLDYQFT